MQNLASDGLSKPIEFRPSSLPKRSQASLRVCKVRKYLLVVYCKNTIVSTHEYIHHELTNHSELSKVMSEYSGLQHRAIFHDAETANSVYC